MIEPLRRLLRKRQRYVVGFDIDRYDWRLFWLDRMQSTGVLPGVHAPREFPFGRSRNG